MAPKDGLEPGTLLAGKLRVLRRLGAGGMGAVYEVEHQLTQHRRALKVLHAALERTPAMTERFLREASAAGRIGSPHIVETFDAGVLDSGEPYLLMELLEGKTLADWIEERRRLPASEACQLVAQACRGLSAAHAAGIIHRDLKPENLFLVGPELSFVKILDFGICKFEENVVGVEPLTGDGCPIGTPSYMSPEQVRGRAALDARTDVYGLGIVLYECLTGELPFTASSLPELAVRIHEGRFKPPSAHCPDLPPELDAVVARALHSDPDARFPSARALEAELVRFAGGKHASLDLTLPGAPKEAEAEPARTEPPAQRRSGVLLAAALSLITLAALLLWSAFWRAPAGVGAADAAPPATSSTRPTPPAPKARSVEPPRPEAAPDAAQAGSDERPRTPPAPRAGRLGAPTPVPPPSAPSRSAEHGLAEENPFR